ncbi:MAG: hypothetical protein NVSMB45_08040 [Ginsengibacter sp.]
MKNTYIIIGLIFLLSSCSKKSGDSPVSPPTPIPSALTVNAVKVNGVSNGNIYHGINPNAEIRFSLSVPVKEASLSSALTFSGANGEVVSFKTAFENNDSTIVIQTSAALKYITKYNVVLSSALTSKDGVTLQSPATITLVTVIDSTDKFPVLTDNDMLDLVQKQTFKYFWDFAHPVSGLARERNTSGETVTTGGSGFGIMSILVGINRNFISRPQGTARIRTIVDFLKNKAQRFHGAFPHWLNGTTGAVIPFSAKDDGADLVETSFLMEGLLSARQYFNGSDPVEISIRTDINLLWNAVEWNWFRQNNQNVLYWHWSPNYNWDMNVQLHGWNEALVTYVLAASSPNYAVPKIVYDNGWAINGSMKNNEVVYGYTLPLGPHLGGPLFFEHYSFLGISPMSLVDGYANYQSQTLNHTKINYEYCKSNPKIYYGYSSLCWGLTASDIPGGYAASSPTNDLGVIAPTAAISSLPYTPVESMQALRFFYNKLGDKIWGDYGFKDAFNLNDPWFADSYLAIDQGPQIIMIENYRSALLWNLFTSCPEVKAGMKSLGFTASYL